MQKNVHKKIVTWLLASALAVALSFGALPSAYADPVVSPGSLVFSDAVISPGSDESQMMFTWYTSQATGMVSVRIQGTDDFALTNTVGTARGSLFVHKAVVSGLLPSTTYEYCFVGNDYSTSAIYTFTTGCPSSFSFLAVGDPQIGSSGNVASDTSGWNNTLNLATTNFPDTSFLLSAGDQVETAGTAAQYAGYLSPEALKYLPIANAVGNHDADSQLFADHFNLPNRYNLGSGATQLDYWFAYGNTLFMVVDSNTTSISGHKAFMQAAIAANPDARWTVVMFHHGPYVNASHRSDSYISSFRTTWIPVFDELQIDVVINGHDHSYVRSNQMLGNVAQTDQLWLNAQKTAVQDPTGTLYMELNSGSGSKYYALTTTTFFVAAQNQANRPNFSVVSVDNNNFTITTYQVNTNNTLTEIDSYTIVKSSEIVEPEPVGLTLTSDKNIVGSDQYFNVSISFSERIESNVINIELTFDADKFDFAGYTPAAGATVLKREAGNGFVNIMLMVPSYQADNLGTVMLKAKPTVGVTNSAIAATVTFVLRDSNLDKVITVADGSYNQKTSNAGSDSFEIDLIVLSNLIDAFGMTSDNPAWASVSHFDYNGNEEIDIFDIVTVAQMVK
ncbi:MAG: metallophosphoesterase family protein [Coriobacteriales bacterium]|jgi:hypothetical protein|nr:metallophosphoesterase family protein [Coriobacteriales bacterium]